MILKLRLFRVGFCYTPVWLRRKECRDFAFQSCDVLSCSRYFSAGAVERMNHIIIISAGSSVVGSFFLISDKICYQTRMEDFRAHRFASLDGLSRTCVCSAVGLDVDQVVDRVSKMLFTAKMPLGRLDGHVAQQELNLVKFPSSIAAQTSADPSEVMWGKLINSCSFGAVLHDMPHDPFRHTISPGLARATNAPKYVTFTQSCGRKPRVNGAFNPVRYGRRPNLSGLADQIDDRPVILAALKMAISNSAASFRRSPQPKRSPSSARSRLPFSVSVRHLPQRSRLVGGQPITEADAEVLWAFDSADASSEIRAEQTGIGKFVRETSDRREPAVDCARRKLT